MPKETGLLAPYPKDLSTHPVLLKLAQDAKRRFSTNGSTVSLMDGGHQVFLAEDAFGGLDALPRECEYPSARAGERVPDLYSTPQRPSARTRS